MSKIAITGASGLAGKHVALRALSLGHEVVAIDISSEAFKDLESAGAHCIQADVLIFTSLSEALNGCDVVFHAASLAGAHHPKALLRSVNVEGTRTVSQAAIKAGVKKFIHLSTVGVYGFSFPKLADEATPLQSERDPYYISKIRSEGVLKKIASDSKMKVHIIRAGELYSKDRLLWMKLSLQELKNKRVIVPGHLTGLISPLHVDNLTNIFEQLITNDPPDLIYNIVDDETLTADQYIKKAFNSDSLIRLPKTLFTLAGWFISAKMVLSSRFTNN